MQNTARQELRQHNRTVCYRIYSCSVTCPRWGGFPLVGSSNFSPPPPPPWDRHMVTSAVHVTMPSWPQLWLTGAWGTCAHVRAEGWSQARESGSLKPRSLSKVLLSPDLQVKAMEIKLGKLSHRFIIVTLCRQYALQSVFRPVGWPSSGNIRRKIVSVLRKVYFQENIELFRLSKKRWTIVGNNLITFGETWFMPKGILKIRARTLRQD